jgi:hypothetical protein
LVQSQLPVMRAAPALASAQAIAPLPKRAESGGVQGGRQAQEVAQVASVQPPQSLPRALPAQSYVAPAQTYAPPLQARAIPPAAPPASAPPQYQQAYQAAPYGQPRSQPQPQWQPQAAQDQELSESSDEPTDAQMSQEDPPPAYVVQTHTPPPQSAYTVQTYQTYAPQPQSQPVQVVQYAPAYGQPVYVPRPPAQAMGQPVIMIGRPPPANYPGAYRRAYWARQYRRPAQVRYGYSVQPANYRGWQ